MEGSQSELEGSCTGPNPTWHMSSGNSEVCWFWWVSLYSYCSGKGPTTDPTIAFFCWRCNNNYGNQSSALACEIPLLSKSGIQAPVRRLGRLRVWFIPSQNTRLMGWVTRGLGRAGNPGGMSVIEVPVVGNLKYVLWFLLLHEQDCLHDTFDVPFPKSVPA